MIGIFDSGVGGLGIFQAITRLLPNESMVYVAGNKYLPFGEKTPEQLQQIAERIVQFLIDTHQVKMVVIACNTSTVATIAHLRSKFTIPFVGVVPVVKPACEQTRTGCVAMLSTPLTAKSAYLEDLIQNFGSGKHVLSIGCPGLADLIEGGKAQSPEVEAQLRHFIAPALEHSADVIGLCCTHYAFVRDQLQAIVGPQVTIIDSNDPVARQVKRVWDSLRDATGGQGVNGPVYQFYATKDAEKFELVARQLIGDVVSNVQLGLV